MMPAEKSDVEIPVWENAGAIKVQACLVRSVPDDDVVQLGPSREIVARREGHPPAVGHAFFNGPLIEFGIGFGEPVATFPGRHQIELPSVVVRDGIRIAGFLKAFHPPRSAPVNGVRAGGAVEAAAAALVLDAPGWKRIRPEQGNPLVPTLGIGVPRIENGSIEMSRDNIVGARTLEFDGAHIRLGPVEPVSRFGQTIDLLITGVHQLWETGGMMVTRVEADYFLAVVMREH